MCLLGYYSDSLIADFGYVDLPEKYLDMMKERIKMEDELFEKTKQTSSSGVTSTQRYFDKHPAETLKYAGQASSVEKAIDMAAKSEGKTVKSVRKPFKKAIKTQDTKVLNQALLNVNQTLENKGINLQQHNVFSRKKLIGFPGNSVAGRHRSAGAIISQSGGGGAGAGIAIAGLGLLGANSLLNSNKQKK